MSNALSFSCVICTLHGPPSLDLLLDSLATQDWKAGDEIIIVDNGMSSERRAQIDARLEHSPTAGVRSWRVEEPTRGVVHARLKSIASSSNPWLFSLDDDNVLTSGAIAQARHCLELHASLGGICPRIEPEWEQPPPPWVVALGHQVLSYNSSVLHRPPSSRVWPPGVVGQRPPTGGMIVSRRIAEEFVSLCTRTPIIFRFTPQGHRRFTGEDFILYSLIYPHRDLSTAYDDGIVVRHLIPESRTKLGYLIRTLFWSNYSFGVQGIMRFGKPLFAYSLLRGGGRLVYELILQSLRAFSWQVLLGYSAAGVGFFFGTFSGLFDPLCTRIYLDRPFNFKNRSSAG